MTCSFPRGLTLALFLFIPALFGQSAAQQVRVLDRQANANVPMGSHRDSRFSCPKGTVLSVIGSKARRLP